MVNQRPELVLVSHSTLTTRLFGPFRVGFSRYLSTFPVTWPSLLSLLWGNLAPRASFQTLFLVAIATCLLIDNSLEKMYPWLCVWFTGYTGHLMVSFELVSQSWPRSFNCIIGFWVNHLPLFRQCQLSIAGVLAGGRRRMRQPLVLPRGYLFSFP